MLKCAEDGGMYQEREGRAEYINEREREGEWRGIEDKDSVVS